MDDKKNKKTLTISKTLTKKIDTTSFSKAGNAQDVEILVDLLPDNSPFAYHINNPPNISPPPPRPSPGLV